MSTSEPTAQSDYQTGVHVILGNAAQQTISYLDNFNDLVTSTETSPTTRSDFYDVAPTDLYPTNLTSYNDSVAPSVLYPADSENVYSSELYFTNSTASNGNIASNTLNPLDNSNSSVYFGPNTTNETNNVESDSSAKPHTTDLTSCNRTTQPTQIFYETNLTDFNLPVEPNSSNMSTANKFITSNLSHPTDSYNNVQTVEPNLTDNANYYNSTTVTPLINANNLNDSFSPTASQTTISKESDKQASTPSQINETNYTGSIEASSLITTESNDYIQPIAPSKATEINYDSNPEFNKPYPTDSIPSDDNRPPFLSTDSNDFSEPSLTNSTASNDSIASALLYPSDSNNSVESTAPSQINQTSTDDGAKPGTLDQTNSNTYQEPTASGLANKTDYTDTAESDKPHSANSSASADSHPPLLSPHADSNDVDKLHPTNLTSLNDSIASDLSHPTDSYDHVSNTGSNLTNEMNDPDGVSQANVSDFNVIHSPAPSLPVNSNNNFEPVAAITGNETGHVIDSTNLTDFNDSNLLPESPKPNPAYGSVFIIGNAPAPYPVGYFGHNYYFVPTGSIVTGVNYYPYSISPVIPYAVNYGFSNYIAPATLYPMYFRTNGYANDFSFLRYPVINSDIYQNRHLKS